MSAISEHPQVLPPDGSGGAKVLQLLDQYPPKLPKYAYGTAGFRYDASVMDAVLVRVAVFCVWWYPQLQSQGSGAGNNTIGIMVTASHNDESYNGVKLVEPNGEILADAQVQGQLTEWVNSDSDKSGEKHPIRQWIEQQQSSSTSSSTPTCIIHVGHDTRSHSPALTNLAVQVIQALGGQVLHHGVATTLLHHAVFHHNPHMVPSMIPIHNDGVGYYQLLAWSYYTLLRTSTNKSKKKLVVDCACGVGYPSVQVFTKTLASIQPTGAASMEFPSTQFCAINGPTHGPLNENCGSEHVQKAMAMPEWYRTPTADASSQGVVESSWGYSAALDGDADRIVFFSADGGKNVNFFLLDGDKITVLLCDFLQTEVADLVQACQTLLKGSSSNKMGSLRLGAVQTAYANGASTKYLKVRLLKTLFGVA